MREEWELRREEERRARAEFDPARGKKLIAKFLETVRDYGRILILWIHKLVLSVPGKSLESVRRMRDLSIMEREM